MRKYLVYILILLCFPGCSMFDLVDGNYKAKGNKLAVIACMNNEANMVLAQALTVAFAENSKFKVFPQKEISKLIPDYPIKIKGPYSSAYTEIEEDYSLTNVKKLNAYQKRLGVDYIYAIWWPGVVNINNAMNNIFAVGQMFAYPDGKDVGHGKFQWLFGLKGGCVIGGGREKMAKNINEAITQLSDYLSKEIAKKMNMEK